MKVLDCINSALKKLSDCGILASRLETELLLCNVLQCKKIELYLQSEKILTQEQLDCFNRFIEKRVQRIPLQQIINEANFFGLKLRIESGVFIPRPETEVLVESLARRINQDFSSEVRILDLCTGSGNVSVALTKNLDDCTIIATDINKKALEIAQFNAQINQVDSKVKFLLGDLFCSLSEQDFRSFDVIVSNPPYIKTKDLLGLPEEVLNDPYDALDGGEDGLEFYRKIVSGCADFLKDNGLIAFEFGDDQALAIADILKKSEMFSDSVFFSDLNQVCRFVIARRNNG